MWFLNRLSDLMLGSPDKPPPTVPSNAHISTLKVVIGDLDMATKKVTNILKCSGEDLSDIFSSIECAENSDELEVALERFNVIMRVFYTAVPAIEHNNLLLHAIKTLTVSQRFESFLNSAATVKDAVDAYKTEIVKKLNIDFKRTQRLERADNEFDKALISCYINNTNPETTFRKAVMADDDNQEEREVRAKKRSYQTHSPLHELSSKKFKRSHQKSNPKHRNICKSFLRGECHRGKMCWNSH